MMTKVTKESVRAVCDIIKDIEKAFNNLDFDSLKNIDRQLVILRAV